MNIFIDGQPITLQKDIFPKHYVSNDLKWENNLLGILGAWYNDGSYSYGYKGTGFLNLSSSGTTGSPKKIHHSRDTVEQVVSSNVKHFGINKNSKILSYYSPRGIGFTVMAVYMAIIADCDVYIETFKGINIIDRINAIKPTHIPILLPNVWKTLHRHHRWKKLDLSSVDVVVTGSDYTPIGMLDELRTHGPAKVYNAYGSTEVPPIVFYSEQENTYTKTDIIKEIDIKIVDGELVCKWSSQNDWWHSGDLVIGDISKFTLCGRKNNMFKQDEIRIFPEDIEKQVIKAGAELVLCQQVGNKCVIHYTGQIDNVDQLHDSLSYVPRLRFKQVDDIKLDDNLRKIIRTQTF